MITSHPPLLPLLTQTVECELNWKFAVNPNWDEQDKAIILHETVADNGVIGMLSGISLNPPNGNAVENDIQDY